MTGEEDTCAPFFALNRLKGQLYDGTTRLFSDDGAQAPIATGMNFCWKVGSTSPYPGYASGKMKVYRLTMGILSKNVYKIILVMTISSLLWFRSHLCDVLGWCCLFNPFLGLKPDITVHLQASKHSGYVFLCWLS